MAAIRASAAPCSWRSLETLLSTTKPIRTSHGAGQRSTRTDDSAHDSGTTSKPIEAESRCERTLMERPSHAGTCLVKCSGACERSHTPGRGITPLPRATIGRPPTNCIVLCINAGPALLVTLDLAPPRRKGRRDKLSGLRAHALDVDTSTRIVTLKKHGERCVSAIANQPGRQRDRRDHKT